MTNEQLLQELRQKETLLPQEFLKDTSVTNLTRSLAAIFESNRSDLEDDVRFRKNFTELVNYVYLTNLSKKPDQRKKDIFNIQLTNFLINTPQAV